MFLFKKWAQSIFYISEHEFVINFNWAQFLTRKKIISVNQLTPEDERFNATISKLHRPKKKQ